MTIPLEPIRKIAAATAEEVAARVELGPEAVAFRTPGLSPQGYLALLDGNRLFGDAVRFLAFALPVREGVWWASMTGRAVAGARAGDPDPCYEAAETWVYEPTEDNRFRCLSAAEDARSATPGAYAALGAFWSGESIAPADLPPVAPAPSLAPTGVAASVLLAVAAGDPKRSEAHFRDAIRRAVAIGNGGDGRPAASPEGRP